MSKPGKLNISSANRRIVQVRGKIACTEVKNLLSVNQITPDSPVWTGRLSTCWFPMFHVFVTLCCRSRELTASWLGLVGVQTVTLLLEDPLLLLPRYQRFRGGDHMPCFPAESHSQTAVMSTRLLRNTTQQNCCDSGGSIKQ